ncbi:hypothetical protein OIV83_005117 [Microbotryomycetes sp. JL201]|nr:hypothetical protein OIV83_005117 [Microbotryomycetes sp. JL201]
MAETPIALWVYDLSHGMASAWGHMLTGTPVDGIWHTSLVLWDMEVFYGQGISIMRPGSTHHGQPVKKLDMGTTLIDKDTFMEYIHGLREQYTASAYHLLEFNCNTFTNDVLGFLNNRSIPQDILDLPKRIMATPFGQQMRPMIDQMFRGPSRPEAQDAVTSFLPATTAEAETITSNLQICSSEASLRNVLQKSPAVAVMYTSVTCPPCQAIKPYFEELARSHGNAPKRIEFVIVDVSVGAGPLIARSSEFGGPVSATPTFILFAGGRKAGECKGTNRRELKTQVQLLEMDVWPPHPHSRAAVPELQALSRTLAPVTFATFPALPTLEAKLQETLSASILQADDRELLSSRTIKYLSSLPPSPSKPPNSPLDPSHLAEWSRATLAALDSVEPSRIFPILDTHRLALARDAKRLAQSPTYAQFLETLVQKFSNDDRLIKCQDRAVLLTLIRLFSNSLVEQNLAAVLLMPKNVQVRSGVVQLGVRGLLSHETSVRTAAAGFSWSVVGRIYDARERGVQGMEDEDFVVEWASALVEAIGREQEVQVLHRLVASLALLYYKTPYVENLKSLLQVLDLTAIFGAKIDVVASHKDDKQVVQLMTELRTLLHS